jgi:hypothetical protein
MELMARESPGPGELGVAVNTIEEQQFSQLCPSSCHPGVAFQQTSMDIVISQVWEN